MKLRARHFATQELVELTIERGRVAAVQVLLPAPAGAVAAPASPELATAAPASQKQPPSVLEQAIAEDHLSDADALSAALLNPIADESPIAPDRPDQWSAPLKQDSPLDRLVTRQQEAENKIDDTTVWIAPGLVDLQINGYGGREFASPQITADDVAAVALVVASQGVTQFLATVTTASFATLRNSVAQIVAAARAWPEVAPLFAGIHLEGPYLSREDGPRGAHPVAECREPDWDEFERLQHAAEGKIRLVTLSAEYAGSAAFIARLVKSGVVASLGHMHATSEQIRACVDAGATLSTHLGNGAHGVLPRHPNYLWDQLAEDRLSAMIIADGQHLPPAVIKSIVRGKSPQRTILVSDLSGYAGLQPGVYDTGLCRLEILADGRLVIAGQTQLLAGAAQPLAVGIVNAIRYAGVDLAAAIQMASTQPAAAVKARCGGLQVGSPADFVLFRLPQDDQGQPKTLDVVTTVVEGDILFGKPPA